MLAVAMTATGVAVCGPISFIGLVVPHMVRRIAGGRHRWLMPFRPDGRVVAGHCRSAGTNHSSAAGASGRRADRHYRRTVVCLAACENAINEITY